MLTWDASLAVSTVDRKRGIRDREIGFSKRVEDVGVVRVRNIVESYAQLSIRKIGISGRNIGISKRNDVGLVRENPIEL